MADRKIYRPWSARIWVPTDQGIVLTLDPWKGAPHYWVPPGGRGELYDHHPEGTAKRELWQETGLRAKTLVRIGEPNLRINRSNPDIPYHLHFFLATLDRKGLRRLKKIGDEDEVIRIFSNDELKNLKNFHPEYKRLLTVNGLWPK